jgi:hypothetical protein
MTPIRGRCPVGERLVVKVPHGSPQDADVRGRFDATASMRLACDQPINAISFRAYVEQFPVPTLPPGEVVVMDNLNTPSRNAPTTSSIPVMVNVKRSRSKRDNELVWLGRVPIEKDHGPALLLSHLTGKIDAHGSLAVSRTLFLVSESRRRKGKAARQVLLDHPLEDRCLQHVLSHLPELNRAYRYNVDTILADRLAARPENGPRRGLREVRKDGEGEHEVELPVPEWNRCRNGVTERQVLSNTTRMA